MTCLHGLSQWKSPPSWAKSLFRRDSACSHTSSYMDTCSTGSNEPLKPAYSEPSCTTSMRPYSSDSNFSIIHFPRPPPCVLAPESFPLRCHNTGVNDYQRIQQMRFSCETPVSDPTTKLGGRNFRWSDFFLKSR